LGTGERVPAATAAFLNGYQIHNQEWDCVHEPAVVHPMAVVLSTLLAYADARGGIDGRRFMRACSTAVDVAASIGCAARNKLRFSRPAMCGALGATAGLAQLNGCDEATTCSALGLAYSQLSGTDASPPRRLAGAADADRLQHPRRIDRHRARLA
jgi:2-methylcitrate dehydratase PrpD